MATTYREWYAKNAEALAAKRKERYRNDPEYRQAQINRAASYKASRAAKAAPTGKNITEVAAELEVSTWTMSRWRKEELFPEPTRVNGVASFTPAQVQLIARIRDFFKKYPKRKAMIHQDELTALVNEIAHNWN